MIILLLKQIFKFIYSFFLLILWVIITPIDLLLTVILPNNKIHKFTNIYYYKNIRIWLTNGKASRTSFIFTQGVTHILFFIIAAFTSWKLFNINSTEVKTKMMRISSYSQTHHKITSFGITWSTDWETDNGKLEGSGFNIKFRPENYNLKDSAHYNFSISTNFDLNADTFTTYYKNLKFTLNEKRSSYIELDVIQTEDIFYPQRIGFTSKAQLFDDYDTPYVNFYLELEGLLSLITDTTQYEIQFFFNDEFKENFANMAYEIIDIKPEPDTNCPYHITYKSKEKIFEIINKGIYISTINKNLKAKKDKESILYSVLIGTLVSVLVRILIELFSKWISLNKTLGREDPFNEIKDNV